MDDYDCDYCEDEGVICRLCRESIHDCVCDFEDDAEEMPCPECCPARNDEEWDDEDEYEWDD